MQFLRVPGLPRLIVTLVAAFALLFPELGHSLAHRHATEHEADAGHYGRVAIQLPSVNSLAAGDHEHGVHPHLDTLMVVLPALYWLYGERAVAGDEAEAEGWNAGPELATVRLA
jgi:hypothetical protein